MDHFSAFVLGTGLVGGLVYDAQTRPEWLSGQFASSVGYLCDHCEENIFKPLNMTSILNRYALGVAILGLFLFPRTRLNSDKDGKRSFPRALFFGGAIYFYAMIFCISAQNLFVCER